MSQFAICKSNESLSTEGGVLLNLQKENRLLYQTALNQYFPNEKYENIWVLDNIHYLCDKQIKKEEYPDSEIFHIMSRLYDVCDWILLWYEGNCGDLDEIQTKEKFLEYIGNRIENPCCELYVRVNKHSKKI